MRKGATEWFIATLEPPLQCCHPRGTPALGTGRGGMRGGKGKALQVEKDKKLLGRETFTHGKQQEPLFLGRC